MRRVFDRGTDGGYLVKEGRSICESDPFDAGWIDDDTAIET